MRVIGRRVKDTHFLKQIIFLKLINSLFWCAYLFNAFFDGCHAQNAHGPRQANLVLIAYASSEGSGEPAHARSLARTSAARSFRQ